jgi:diguanylate cyclase (GGDEF)-like protein/putative nucleotidyltransferase with HDIG domain
VRVADLACAIAARCGFEGQTLFWFRIGALLHDVGKLVVPSEILNKAGKLDPAEWELMRSHPSAGVDVLAGVDFPWDVRPIIESHHERWDGKGYPHGLAGEDIPLSARILAVADVYDALTSVRSYKRAFSHDEAVAIMRDDVGRMFDPDVFAQFERVIAEGPLPVAREVAHVGGVMERADLAPRSKIAESETLDGMTELPGRDSLERIATQVLRDRRTTHEPASLLVVEVDLAPCSRGASVEMRERTVLRTVARQLRRETRSSDFVARMDSRRFMALLAGSPIANAEAILQRLQSSLENALRQRTGSAIRLASVRAAAVAVTDDIQTCEELFSRGLASVSRLTAEAAAAANLPAEAY